jgi:hypothetical protein
LNFHINWCCVVIKNIAVSDRIGSVLFLCVILLFPSSTIRFHLKPAKKLKMKKKQGGTPLPLDILDRLPDKVIAQQLRRLEPKSISRMTALANARGALSPSVEDGGE